VNNLEGMVLHVTIESDGDSDLEFEQYRWAVGLIIALKLERAAHDRGPFWIT